jgi:hypothetical protein
MEQKYGYLTVMYINLPFEKVQHLILKDILGVHNKASNLAIKYMK